MREEFSYTFNYHRSVPRLITGRFRCINVKCIKVLTSNVQVKKSHCFIGEFTAQAARGTF